jgi:hypothetical protein
VAPLAGRLADRYPAGILGSIAIAIVGIGHVLIVILPASATFCGGCRLRRRHEAISAAERLLDIDRCTRECSGGKAREATAGSREPW